MVCLLSASPSDLILPNPRLSSVGREGKKSTCLTPRGLKQRIFCHGDPGAWLAHKGGLTASLSQQAEDGLGLIFGTGTGHTHTHVHMACTPSCNSCRSESRFHAGEALHSTVVLVQALNTLSPHGL